MRKIICFSFFIFHFSFFTSAQSPKTYTSSEILLQLKKLNVLGSVLYVAAHPDDENSRLLAYLANGRLYRTGYLSLTRGDGGQNLVGDEQGVELGLIRTQELLAARRIDGAEQFFSRAYDFGYCKTPEEALKTWGHDKILSDVVWVIRKFRPDIIITRFPEDSRAGHGHHSASAILAREAFSAAADSTEFPEQLKEGVTVWQAKRILWNTYNFGGNNTENEDQLKIDCGGYNPLLGKSYGEIAALSRSQHKSQGFGIAAQRGKALEYFAIVKGDKPTMDLMDGVNTSWQRIPGDISEAVENRVQNIITDFLPANPEKSVDALVSLYQSVSKTPDEYWKEEKLKEIRMIIKECAGLFLEATTNTQYAVQGDSLKVNFVIDNRLGATIKNANVSFKAIHHDFDSIKDDINETYSQTIFIKQDEKLTQPYWLVEPMDKGSYNVSNQQLIGKAQNDPVSAEFVLDIDGTDFRYNVPVRYTYTDHVRGEEYEPLAVVPSVSIDVTPKIIFDTKELSHPYTISIIPYKNIGLRHYDMTSVNSCDHNWDKSSFSDSLQIGQQKTFTLDKHSYTNQAGVCINGVRLEDTRDGINYTKTIREIKYNYIPTITYFKGADIKFIDGNLKTSGKNIGYIAGAGDKVPPALEQMGYQITMLKEADLTSNNLKQFDAIVTGVRAYNVNSWMDNVYDTLMQYIKNGGVLLVQYNTNYKNAPLKARIGPYPFTVTTKRITDETAKVNFLLPNNPALDYPNKITEEDFDGWIQERSIYDVENIDSHYQRIISMKDPGETEQDGSLLVTDYGKGKFVYTGLVFFRELPAGVPGAYRLFANLLANKKEK